MDWRTVRVFISSTFRDMHAERDWLVRRVFPSLREKLEPYRVHLVDIDLRWGVTREQADNGEALDVCLTHIDERRPLFLGILGDRYGSVADRVPERVADRWGWVRDHPGKSITELEILYGVLNDPVMRDRSLFCFRDPAFLTDPAFQRDVPADAQRDMRVEGDEHRVKLATLKDAIRTASRDHWVPLMDGYPCRFAGVRADGRVRLDGLEAFGRRVHTWLWKWIRRELHLPPTPPEAAATDPAAERGYHERFQESRLRVYVGREGLHQSLTDFADGDERVPCLVTGPSGSGKSAALARFAADHPAALVVTHFVGASPTSTGLRPTLLRLCGALKAAFEWTDDVPPDVGGLIAAFRRFVDRVPTDRRVVLVIDALNQLDEADAAHALGWLPWTLPPHVKLVVSCIADEGREEPVLRAFAGREHRRVAVEPLTAAERDGILRAVPSLSAKTLDPLQVGLLMTNPATENPLFLLVALEELRGFGSFEQLDVRIAEFPRPLDDAPRWPGWLSEARKAANRIADDKKRQVTTDRLDRIERALKNVTPSTDPVSALFGQVIDRLGIDFDPAVVQTVFRLLASARRGLSDRELLDLTEGPTVAVGASEGDLFPVLRQVRAYLQHRGRLWDFFHRNLFKAVRERYLSAAADRADAHTRLADYFRGQAYFLEPEAEQRARARRLPPTPRPANVRKVDELPYQLLEVAKLLGTDDQACPLWGAVADLFTDLHFLEAKAEVVG